MNDANKRTLLDWFKELKTGKLLNVNIGGMTSGAGLATEATLQNVQTNTTNIETFTNATWEALGKPTTTVADDGDLQTVDTETEALAVNPTANAAGAASVKYSIAFLWRWSVSLFQSIVNSLRPSASSVYAITPYVSAAQEASAVVKASAGNLYGFVFTNNNAATRYVQVFNAAALPGDGTVPALSFPVSSGGVFPFDTGKYPNQFTNGIVFCNSTTQATKTIGAADSLFYVQYK